MSRSKLALSVVIISLIIFLGTAYALKVSPGVFTAMGVPVGEKTDLGIRFTIENDLDSEQSFSINMIRPSEVKKDWLRGYQDIPDPEWLFIEGGEMTIVPAHGKVEMTLFLEIPDEERYYNQHWMVYVMVNQVGEGMFQTSVAPAYMIETRSEKTLTGPPYGEFGLAPSILGFENILIGHSQTAFFTIYNNDTLTHLYTLNPEIPHQEDGNLVIENRDGYSWFDMGKWLQFSEIQFELPPGESKEIAVNLTIPEDVKLAAGKYESLIFAQPDQGRAGFIRVRMDLGMDE